MTNPDRLAASQLEYFNDAALGQIDRMHVEFLLDSAARCERIAAIWRDQSADGETRTRLEHIAFWSDKAATMSAKARELMGIE